VARASSVLVLLVSGCVGHLRPVETQVRRVDSLGSVDAVADELGVDGWHVVDVEPMQGGASFVVVLQRETAP
jgi:hypothetical protein